MEIQWPLALFTLLTSMGGCLFLFVGINEFTRKSSVSGFVPAIVALVLAVIGGLCSVAHLAHVDRMLNALSHPTSGIFVEAVLIGLLAVAVIVYLVCVKREIAGGIKASAVCGMVFGVALSFMAGHSYIMAAIDTWNTMLLPTGYLLTALPMGSSLYWALAGREEAASKFMGVCTLVCGVLGFLGAAAYAAVAGAFSGESMMLAVGALVLAGVVPAVIGALGTKTASPALPWVAFVCAVIGALCYRVMMWVVFTTPFNFFGVM